MSPDSRGKRVVHAHISRTLYKVDLQSESHQLVADEPEKNGGQDTGPDPYDYLLISLGSCTAMTVRMYADRKDWPLEEVYVELMHSKTHADDCQNSEKKQSKIDHIEKDITVVGDLTEKQQNRLLEISERCPVHRTLQSDIKITSQLSNKQEA